MACVLSLFLCFSPSSSGPRLRLCSNVPSQAPSLSWTSFSSCSRLQLPGRGGLSIGKQKREYAYILGVFYSFCLGVSCMFVSDCPLAPRLSSSSPLLLRTKTKGLEQFHSSIHPSASQSTGPKPDKKARSSLSSARNGNEAARARFALFLSRNRPTFKPSRVKSSRGEGDCMERSQNRRPQGKRRTYGMTAMGPPR